MAQRRASRSVFHATPHRVDPVTQPVPHTFWVNRRWPNAASDSDSFASCAAEIRMRKTGKNVKIATRTATATAEPATNASPLK